MRIDIHQHVWTAPLVEALADRRTLPFARLDDHLCTIHCAGEPPSVIDLGGESAARRHALFERDGIDLALVAISSPLGIEALPRAQASELIDAHLDGVASLGEGFAAWGPVPLDRVSSADVDEVLARGCVGISFPAGTLCAPTAVERLRDVLSRIEELDVPLFVHPGPALGERVTEGTLGDPLWWPAMTRYVAQMQAAWLALFVDARHRHPRLRLVFAMLAGGAPLLAERLWARGGPRVELASARVFYDTSSFGAAAVDAMAARVGREQLLYGSDRPVVEPLTEAYDRTVAGNACWIVERAVAVAG